MGNHALLDTLVRLPHDSKAELVGDEIHSMSPTGELPGRAALKIVISLAMHEGKTAGRAFGDNVGFLGCRSARAGNYQGVPGGRVYDTR